MLQIGRYSYRGTGAVMVAGPLGVALVPPEWAKGAREALIGRAEIVAWLTQVSQAGADAAVLDLAGPQAHLSLLGRAWVRALAPGLAEAQEWQAPVWGWALNPGDWECLDVELGVAEAERLLKMSSLCFKRTGYSRRIRHFGFFCLTCSTLVFYYGALSAAQITIRSTTASIVCFL